MENTETGEKKLKKVLSVSVTETKMLAHPGALVSLRSGLTLEEAKQKIMYWGDVWAVDEAAAIHLCNELGGISNEGATRDNNPDNALHYHAVMSLEHHHIFFGLDKNLIFTP